MRVKGRSAIWKICILPQFWISDTHQMPRGSLGDVKNPRFTHEVTRGSFGNVKIRISPQFWASEQHEVRRGSLGNAKNSHFTTVLSVRSARSDERVVKSWGGEKRIDFKRLLKKKATFAQFVSSYHLSAVFSRVFEDGHHFSSLWSKSFKTAITSAVFSSYLFLKSSKTTITSAVFSGVFEDSHHFGSLWSQSFKTAITSAVFDHSLSRQPSLWQSLITVFRDSDHFSSLWWQSLMTVLFSKEPFAVAFGN